MTPSEIRLDIAFRYIFSLLGTPYKLGGNVTQDGGLDCSALMLEYLRSLGLWGKSDATAHDIYMKFKHFGFEEGTPFRSHCLMFFGTAEKVTHISLSINPYQMIEAGGTNEDGMVRIRPTSWRKDIVAVVPVDLLLK